MTGIALLLLAASVGHGLARALRLPALPFLVLAGFGLGLIGAVPDDFLQDSLVLGITFLVFKAGIELDPSRVRQMKGAALAVGLVQFLLVGGLGLVVAGVLGFDAHTSAYLALALTASSTLVAVRVLQSRRELFEPFGRLVIGALLLQDLLVILLIPVLTGLPEGASRIARGVGVTLLLVGVAWILVRPLMPRLLERLALDEERLLLVVLSHLFLFLFLADALGVPPVTGAFVAGVALSSFPVNGVVRGRLTSIGDFFSAVLFTALGAVVGLPGSSELAQAVILAGIVLVATPITVAVVAEWAGFSARPAILSGLLLAQTSEFSLVVGLRGVALGHLAPEAFRVIVVVTVATMVLTPLLATDRVVLFLLRLHPARRQRAGGEVPSNHLLLIGCGSSGRPLLETLVIGRHPIVAVDDDPRVVASLRAADVDAYKGDVTDPTLLRRVGAARARVIVSTVPRPEDHEALLRAVDDVPTVVRVFEDADARRLARRGARPVVFGAAAADAFLDWFDRVGPETRDDLAARELDDVL